MRFFQINPQGNGYEEVAPIDESELRMVKKHNQLLERLLMLEARVEELENRVLSDKQNNQ